MFQQHATKQDEAPEIHSVRSLTLSNFRNHQYTLLEVDGQSVVLFGPNGAGKTNILEAISLLAPGRGFRRAKLREMISPTGAPWVVSAHIHGAVGDTQIGTSLESTPSVYGGGRGEAISFSEVYPPSPPQVGGLYNFPPASGGSVSAAADRRLVRVNGEPLKNANELSEYVSILWLTPQMDQIFLEGGTARRKFLDRLVYGFDPPHATRINRYELAMRERNKLLEVRTQDDWLASIEAQMAEIGTAIAFARHEAISHINQVMQMSALDFPKAHLALDGPLERAVAEGAAALDIEASYRQLLAQSRGEDARAGRTLVGVHRAEFTVTHLGKQMEAASCSTGEQKALLLAIVLAEARASSLWHGHVPILLLDEVAAHLDPKKRHELYMELQELKAQSWMSGVDSDLFEEMHDNSVFFRVELGKIFGE